MDSPSDSQSHLRTIEIDDMSYMIDLPFEDTDYIQGLIRQSGAPYELDMLRAIAATLERNDLVIDVGANVGNHTLYLAAVCGAQVIAYEPDPRLTIAIERSARANDLAGSITVRTVAVAESPGELVLVDDVDGNLGGQHLVSDPESGGLRVPVTRLDDEMPDARVRAMKIDVEGFELNVLEGADALIRRDHPDLWIECLDADHFRSISAQIAPLGYRFNGVFNPSPTYHFVHDPRPSAEALTDAVNRAIERFYTDHALFVRTRESLIEANAKYRTVTQQYADLRDRSVQGGQVGAEEPSTNARLLRQAEERVTSLQADLTRLLEEKHRVVEAALRREAEAVSEVRELRTARERLTRQARRRARRDRTRLQDALALHSAATAQHAAELAAVGSSLAAAEGALATAKQEAATREQLLGEKELQLAALGVKQARYRADFDLLRDHISRTDITLETTEGDLEEERAKRAEAEDHLSRAERTLDETARRASELEKRGATLVRARDAQIALAASRGDEVQALTAERADLRKEILDGEKKQRVLARSRDAQRALVDELRDALTARDAELQNISTARESLKARGDEVQRELEQAQSELSALRQSRTYRAGKAWRDAATWNGFWALVPRLIKIATERSH